MPRPFEVETVLEQSDSKSTGLALVWNPEEYDILTLPGLPGLSVRQMWQNGKESYLLLENADRGTSYIIESTEDGELRVLKGGSVDHSLTYNRVFFDKELITREDEPEDPREDE